MEESPPPVPPKDRGYQSRASSMDIDRPRTSRSSAPASGSKRKREAFSDNIDASHHGRLAATDDEDEGQTPAKRTRSHAGYSDGDLDFSDETPAQQRNVRRKKGIRNLSNLNLRHAASAQKLGLPRSPPRESRFQEGSLTDKPSEKPPSVFTRFTRTDSGNLQYAEELMADYHNGMPTPKTSVEEVVEREKAMMPQRVAEINAQEKKEESPGMFRFGRSWKSNFHPVTLWNRLWNDTKEELTRQNMLEAERKARLKAEAEAKYAQMKSAGAFGGQPMALDNAFGNTVTPHDSAVALENGSRQHVRSTSNGSQLRPSDDSTRDGTEVPEPPRTIRGRLSRLQLRRPSMSSLTGTIKRTKSEFNLAASAANRESSSSASPMKADFDGSTSILRQSHSKYDLKKQTRLSKRVSDLESKLHKARLELEGALADASPMPKLGNKYERFTPMSTLKRPKFVPGGLPTLPSERLLSQGLLGPEAISDDSNVFGVKASEPRARNAIDLSEAFDDIDEDETVRPRGKVCRTHASSIFSSNGKNKDKSPLITHNDKNQDPEQAIPTFQLTEATEVSVMDPNSIVNAPSIDVPEPAEKPTYDGLDAKLKALDDSVKAAKKPAKSKKRTTLNDDEKLFKPGKSVDDDDAEWEEAAQTPKKKRKSGGEAKSSPSTMGTGKQKAPQKKLLKKTVNAAATKKSKKNSGGEEEVTQVTTSQTTQDTEMNDASGSEDELAKMDSRNSIDADVQSLEPLYEEEEETTTGPLNTEPTMPTATATPARYGCSTARSRSNSPHKRSGPVMPGAEEKMFTRAANAAQMSRGSRSVSPPLAKGHTKRADVTNGTLSIVPGKDGVPKLPGAELANREEATKRGCKKKQATGENFEWPDDVF